MNQIFNILPFCHVRYKKPGREQDSNGRKEQAPAEQGIGKVLIIDETNPEHKVAVVSDLDSKFVESVDLDSCVLLRAYATGCYYDTHGKKLTDE